MKEMSEIYVETVFYKDIAIVHAIQSVFFEFQGD
jgi:hypothetical protein